MEPAKKVRESGEKREKREGRVSVEAKEREKWTSEDEEVTRDSRDGG